MLKTYQNQIFNIFKGNFAEKIIWILSLPCEKYKNSDQKI